MCCMKDRIRLRSRRLSRSNNRTLTTRANDPLLRRVIPRAQGPDHLSKALTAFARAIRCHRRIAKLSPRHFDSAIIQKDLRDKIDMARRTAWILPMLNKAYGLPPDTPAGIEPEDFPPPLPHWRTQRCVETELAQLEVWLNIGKDEMDRWRIRRPHATPSFAQIARLIHIANSFASLACGTERD